MVLFKGTMHHVENPIGALSEARRVCRKDGRIVIVDFILFPAGWLRWPNLKWRLRHPSRLWAKPPDKCPGFSEEDVKSYVQNLNLGLERYDPNFATGHHSGHDAPLFLAVAKRADFVAG